MVIYNGYATKKTPIKLERMRSLRCMGSIKICLKLFFFFMCVKAIGKT